MNTNSRSARPEIRVPKSEQAKQKEKKLRLSKHDAGAGLYGASALAPARCFYAQEVPPSVRLCSFHIYQPAGSERKRQVFSNVVYRCCSSLSILPTISF